LTLNPRPNFDSNLNPSTLEPELEILNLTLNPKPNFDWNLNPSTLDPEPKTLNHQLSTLNKKVDSEPGTKL
jgi:hypothetical protein